MSALRMYAAYRDWWTAHVAQPAAAGAEPEPEREPRPLPHRHCKACDVKWRGDTPCWVCGQPGSDY